MAQTKRTSFVFYDGFYEAIQELETAEEKVELLDAICTYEFTGEIPEMSYACRVAFKVIKKSLDIATTRYLASVENGKKGGRPKKEENLGEPNETYNNLGEPNETYNNLGEPTGTQGNHNDNVNGNGNGNVSESASENASESEKQGTCETSSPSVAKPTTSSKRTSRKEQLLSYVGDLDYTEETKDALLKWIFQIGIGRGVTVNQLQDMLKDIWDKYDDENLVRESIKESYLKNWFGFFPLKNTVVNPKDKPKVEQKKADPTKIMDIVF